MNTLLRSCTALALMGLLVLTSVSMAVARAAPDAAGHIVLCTGQGAVVVPVDEDGQPLDQAHYCPDCAFSMLAGLLPVVEQVHLIGAPLKVGYETAASWDIAQKIHAALARGPPVPVVA